MVISVKISLCKITSSSKLFQRNYYLPLLKPLSPKDALRKKIITGQNILGSRIEHYIPVLTSQEDKSLERRHRVKGAPVIKKRIKKKESEKYLEPFVDEELDNHSLFQRLLNKKGEFPKGQHYVYEVLDKGYNLVFSPQMEKAIKDKDIIDVVIAQRSEKIVVKLQNGLKITLPLAKYQGHYPLYRGGGWTEHHAEKDHHHGKETMSMARLFEAKEAGVEDWELEMMRLASKRKKKVKGEESQDWRKMVTSCVEDMDWDKFEEDTKQIVEEQQEIVEEEDIPMAVENVDMTRDVAEKLSAVGEAALNQLPEMKEIPEVIKSLENGEMAEINQVSGVKLQLADGKECFVVGQMVKTDDQEVFVPGQTVENEGVAEYTPGITILMEGEAVLIPGLVMGEEEKPAMFLPGESVIVEGQLKFEATEEDICRLRTPSDTPSVESIEEPVIVEEKIVRIKEVSPVEEMKIFNLEELEEARRKREEEEKKRQKDRKEEKILKEESKVDMLRLNVRKKMRELKIEKPEEWVPLAPVKKSDKLVELERSIEKGTFFAEDRTREILDRARSSTRMLKYQYVLPPFGKFSKY